MVVVFVVVGIAMGGMVTGAIVADGVATAGTIGSPVPDPPILICGAMGSTLGFANTEDAVAFRSGSFSGLGGRSLFGSADLPASFFASVEFVDTNDCFVPP